MASVLYRAFSVNHKTLEIHHIGDWADRDLAVQAAYEDQLDEPAPDKHLFFSWHTEPIDSSLAIGKGMEVILPPPGPMPKPNFGKGKHRNP